MLTIRYDISAERVLDDRQFAHDLPLMKRAGVDTLYLNTYFYGHWQSEPEEIYRAAQRLREEGICAEILHVPFGHGGNALAAAYGRERAPASQYHLSERKVYCRHTGSQPHDAADGLFDVLSG